MSVVVLKSQSAQGILSLMEEDDLHLKIYALKKLDLIVDQTWPEIAQHLESLDQMCADDNFPERCLAASVASKIFYHLQDYENCVKLALEAGDKFNIIKN